MEVQLQGADGGIKENVREFEKTKIDLQFFSPLT